MSALSVACSSCGAQPGRYCLPEPPRNRASHAARLLAADAEPAIDLGAVLADRDEAESALVVLVAEVALLRSALLLAQVERDVAEAALERVARAASLPDARRVAEMSLYDPLEVAL